MESEAKGNAKLTVNDVAEILKVNGRTVSYEQAQEILNLLNALAKLEVQQYLNR
jgi:hypothetical protein